MTTRAFSTPSGVTPLTRNSSYKASFNIPITLRPSFALVSARKCSSLSLPLLCKCNSTSISAPKSSRKPVISEGRDEDLTRHICPGCGVFMQDSDPNLPGYYKTPTFKDKDSSADGVHLADSDEFSEIGDELVNELSEESDSDEEMEDLSDYVEIDLGSDWEDNGTLEKSTKGKTLKIDRKNKVKDELARASFSDFVEIDLGSDWEDNRTLKKSTKGKTLKFDRKNKVKGELASASFSDFVETDLGSDWEDNGTLEKSTKGKTLKFDGKNKVKGELASASLEENDSDKETIELSDFDQMGNGGFDQDSNFKEPEILESERDKNIGEKSKGNRKLSSKRKSRRKSRFKFSGLDQFLEEEESEDGSFSNSDVDEGFEEFEDLDEEETDWDKDWDELDEEEKWKREMDGFAPPGVGYGNITEEYLKKIKKEKISKSEKKRKLREEAKRAKQEAGMVTVCARCHSLRNYGQIKNPNVENLIPDFDFDRFISTRLMKPAGATSVVVMVVDCTDFDGSFPKVAAKSLFKALEGTRTKVSRLPKLILVATKVDLLPSQVSPTRLNKWVRGRAKDNGAHKLDSVIQVSSHKDLNIRNLISCIKQSAGPRGNVWVVGAQNAGKSTLINAFAKKEGVKIARLTEAAVPGTTLGILRVTGILPAKVKMYDTPGLLHPELMMNRLNREEQKMVEIRKELRPRSYRVKAGQTVHVGGLMRLDLIQASVQTIYITVWASPSISLHMGKIDNADELRKSHFGARLQPPIGQDRVAELGDWKKRDFKVCGISWDVNSVDIAVSGVGWFSLGMKGEAKVALWTFAGVEVVQREPLVLDRAPFLERPGFLLPQAISDLIGKENKRKSEARKKREEQIEDEELLLEASV